MNSFRVCDHALLEILPRLRSWLDLIGKEETVVGSLVRYNVFLMDPRQASSYTFMFMQHIFERVGPDSCVKVVAKFH